MNLSTKATDITDAEWVLAWSLLIARRDGKPVAKRAAALEEQCGSPTRALQVLTTVRYYMVDADISEAIRLANSRHLRPVPRTTSDASSQARRAAPPSTTTAVAARRERIRMTVLWFGITLPAIVTAIEIIKGLHR